uniref:Uncharacterized protein n=1 Tax=Anguilla anguilla TaxID=7936 RepID=A0A0E9UP49_ANGAN
MFNIAELFTLYLLSISPTILMRGLAPCTMHSIQYILK